MSSPNVLIDLWLLEFMRLIGVPDPPLKGSRVAGELIVLTESVSKVI